MTRRDFLKAAPAAAMAAAISPLPAPKAVAATWYLDIRLDQLERAELTRKFHFEYTKLLCEDLAAQFADIKKANSNDDQA